jgi:hypothetical protein
MLNSPAKIALIVVIALAGLVAAGWFILLNPTAFMFTMRILHPEGPRFVPESEYLDKV